MNRATKRYMQKQGTVAQDGTPSAPEPRTRAPKPTQQARRSPGEYIREVVAELQKVAWPSRTETINYSVVVLICLVVLITGIFGLDYVSSKLVLFLFQ